MTESTKETTMTALPPETASDWSTADLADDHGSSVRSCDVQFRSYGATASFSGPITTIACHEDNVVMRAALSEPGNGGVLVVDGGGSVHVALMGDEMALLAVRNGWSGVIVNGAVRDVAALAGIGLGVFAVGSNPRKSLKHGAGERDVPVSFGGVVFTPGETVYADRDGVVVA
jgi:regulator of ribonuclease activity A